MNCFRAWEEWAIYPNDFLIRLQNIFLGLTKQLDLVPSSPEEIPDVEPDVDGMPLDHDVDGAPLPDVDGMPLVEADIDGEPCN